MKKHETIEKAEKLTAERAREDHPVRLALRRRC